jgi:hypothetical protein
LTCLRLIPEEEESMKQRTFEIPTGDPGSEWRDADLVDRAEQAEAEAAMLRETLERRETELTIARLWVKELALWLDEANSRQDARWSAPLSALRLSPRTEPILQQRLDGPQPWRLATVAAIVAAPWLVLGLLAWGGLAVT